MQKVLVGLVAVSSLVFGAGCGGLETEPDEVCENFYKALQNVSEKAKDCGDDSPLTDAQTKTAIDQCKTVISSCTEEDREKIAEAAECLENEVDECRSANDQDEFSGQVIACVIKGGRTSDACSIEPEEAGD